MKILYLITKSEIGGAQVHVRDLMQSMVKDGHDVALMSYPGGWLTKEAENIGIKFYANQNFSNSLNPLNALKAILNIKKAVKDFSPDLVSIHSSGAGFFGRLAIRGRIPTVFTAHSFAFTDGAQAWRKIIAIVAEKIVARYTNQIICVSDFDRRLALRYRIAESEKLVTIYNGVGSAGVGGAEREKIILANGRLAYPKDYMLLLEAYKLANLDSFRLEIISDGPDRGKIERKISELNLESRVVLLGNRTQAEVRKKLLQSKVFILISKHEGLPLSILEAMSAGLPVIASSVGGISEEIDCSCGILVVNTKEDIARALVTLSDEITQKQMGEFARQKFEEKFTLDKFLEETKKVYLDCVRF